MISSFPSKKSFIEKGFPGPVGSLTTLDLNYYGIKLRVSCSSPDFIGSLKNFHPAEWAVTHVDPSYEFIFMDYATHFNRDFFEETDPEFHVFNVKSAKVCIQRDFIGWTFDGKKFYFITDLTVDDGYFNCMRWAIPGILLREQSLVLHSSCFVSKNDNEAYMFLGQSGAGKTTTVTSFPEGIILGDDMNVVSFIDGSAYVQSGAIGGQVYYPRFEKRFKLKGMFWLRKNNSLNISPVSIEEARLRLLGSVANLFFGFEDASFVDLAIDQIDKLSQLVPMYELKLMKGDNIWPVLQNL